MQFPPSDGPRRIKGMNCIDSWFNCTSFLRMSMTRIWGPLGGEWIIIKWQKGSSVHIKLQMRHRSRYFVGALAKHDHQSKAPNGIQTCIHTPIDHSPRAST
ncbi:hypothetical protein BDR06DRAFT_143818 [Suillus hirtellus]|nr:hypothetical protein BDR06DRAFT_143818 [Suillus hirtellus]